MNLALINRFFFFVVLFILGGGYIFSIMNIKIISIIIVARSVPEARMVKQIHTHTRLFKGEKKLKKKEKYMHPVAGLSLTEYITHSPSPSIWNKAYRGVE